MVKRLIATRVGVHTEAPTWVGGATPVPCARCGTERQVSMRRVVPEMCRDCRVIEPLWGQVPFEQLPVSDSNLDAFDEPYDKPENFRRRATRARRKHREETP